MSKLPTLAGIARTLIWTLRSRVDEHLRPDGLFRDPIAAEWYPLVADQASIDHWYSAEFQTTIAIRARIYDDAARQFLISHANPLVVELGAGLSSRYYRLNKPASPWIELDLPEVIALRRQLETETESHTLIAGSVIDSGWITRLPAVAPDSALFIAEGLFMFLKRVERDMLIHQLRRFFPGATLLLDVPGSLTQYGEAKIAADEGTPFEWLVGDERDIAALGLNLVNVWPLIEQFPNRMRLVLSDTLVTPALRNATLMVQAVLPPLNHGIAVHQPTPAYPVHDASTQPVLYRGQSLNAPKQFVYGTHRACPPEETLSRIQPHFRQTGITRIADITGLDRIGIPVTLVLRPNAPTMSNSTGKGLTPIASIVSGAMESIEIYHAENVKLPVASQTYRQMAQAGQVIPLESLPLIKNSLFHTDLLERWVTGWDLIHQEEVAAPLTVVEMAWNVRSLATMINFQVGSNGLASGNHLLEAITAGLLEVVERDAVACHQMAWRSLGFPPPRVRLDTIRSGPVQDLLWQFRAAQVYPILFEMTIDTRVPVYMAYVIDMVASDAGVSVGYGAHLDPEIAIVRSLTEAAQGRVVLMSGSRDEYFRHHYMMFKKHANVSREHVLAHIPETVNVSERKSYATTSFEGDLRTILAFLQQVGLNQVIVFDLSLSGIDIPVVRIVVPGLEGYMFAYYVPGKRAVSFAKKTKRRAG